MDSRLRTLCEELETVERSCVNAQSDLPFSARSMAIGRRIVALFDQAQTVQDAGPTPEEMVRAFMSLGILEAHEADPDETVSLTRPIFAWWHRRARETSFRSLICLFLALIVAPIHLWIVGYSVWPLLLLILACVQAMPASEDEEIMLKAIWSAARGDDLRMLVKHELFLQPSDSHARTTLTFILVAAVESAQHPERYRSDLARFSLLLRGIRVHGVPTYLLPGGKLIFARLPGSPC